MESIRNFGRDCHLGGIKLAMGSIFRTKKGDFPDNTKVENVHKHKMATQRPRKIKNICVCCEDITMPKGKEKDDLRK